MQDHISTQAFAEEPRAFDENEFARRRDISFRMLQQ